MPDNPCYRLTAKLTIPASINVLVEPALGNFRGKLKVIQQFFFGGVKHIKLNVFAEIGAVDQQLQATPRRLQLLKAIVVKNLINLPTNFPVKFNDHAIYNGFINLRGSVLAA